MWRWRERKIEVERERSEAWVVGYGQCEKWARVLSCSYLFECQKEQRERKKGKIKNKKALQTINHLQYNFLMFKK